MVVDDAGRADPDTEHGGVRVGDELAGEPDDGGEDVGGVGGHGCLVAGDDLPVEGQHGSEDAVTAREIEPDDAVALPIEVDEDAGLAGAGDLAGATLGDVAVFDELGDEVGDRDTRETGLA